MVNRAEPPIPGYRAFDVVGSGATSVVYRAWHDATRRYVAVKVLQVDDPHDPALPRFERERETLGRLGSHPHIVQVFDAGLSADGRPFVVMQLYAGSVADWLTKRQTTFAEGDAAAVVAAIAGATERAHEHDVLHRDIKPENVLLSRDGPGLADFGIAASSQAGVDPDRRFTPRHTAPEVLDGSGAPSVQSDIWSLGSTLYTMLSGRPPFERREGEAPLAFSLRVRVEPLRDIPRRIDPSLLAAVQAMLAKDPSDRPRSAGEARDLLDAVASRHGKHDWPSLPDASPEAPPPEGLPARPGGTGPATAMPVTQAAGAPAMVIPEGATEAPGPRPDSDADSTQEAKSQRGARRPSRTLVAVTAAALSAVGVVFAAGFLLPDSDTSPQRSATTLTVPPSVAAVPTAADLAPTDLAADDFGDTVDLHWTDNSEGLMQYAVTYRSVGGEQQTVVVDDGLTAVTIRGLDPTLGYCFRVLGIGQDASGEVVETSADVGIRGCVAEPPA